MFSTRDLYYLKQMGIQPWVKKEKLDATLGERSKLLIITDSDLSVKERKLLDQIISFIVLDNADYQHLELKGKNLLELTTNAELILSFSSKINSEYNVNPLSEIINQPRYKKELFNLLVALKDKYKAL